jgi:hypothetical protein
MSIVVSSSINKEGAENHSINKMKLISSTYLKESKEEIPKNVIEIKKENFKKKEYGKISLLKRKQESIVYITFVYPILLDEPIFTSIKQKDKQIIIKVKNPRTDVTGLMQSSYFTYKITVTGEVEDVILKESFK